MQFVVNNQLEEYIYSYEGLMSTQIQIPSTCTPSCHDMSIRASRISVSESLYIHYDAGNLSYADSEDLGHDKILYLKGAPGVGIFESCVINITWI